MTEIEISKALALAIGWKQVITSAATDICYVCLDTQAWRVFDYRSPDVIWPIAKHFDMFPSISGDTGEWCVMGQFDYHYAATPELAVAMAVIGGAQ